MKMHLRELFVGILLAMGVLCLVDGGAAGGGNATGFKEFLDARDARELSNRALKEAKEALAGKPDEDAIQKAQFHLLTVAALARSLKGGDAAKRGEVYQNALHVVNLLGQKGKLAQARAFRTQGSSINKSGFAGDLPKTGVLVAALMEHYKTKAKGGEGLPTVLQSSLKLKGIQNGIEEKIRTLAMKKLLPGVLEKESEELALLANRVAVVGEVVYQFAPAKKIGMKDPAEWRQYSLAMRDAGIELAEAARKKDAEAVFKAGNRLNSSCSQCHSTFRLGK